MLRYLAIIAVTTLLIAGCGQGGGGPLPFYITDVPGDHYPGVEITLFDVNLCDDHLCRATVNLFHRDAGLMVDLVGLDGILQYITTADIPGGTYNRLELILGGMATITDSSASSHPAYFAPMTSDPNKANAVLCPAALLGRCLIRFNGAVQPFALGQFIIDFDLKEFVVEEAPCAGAPDPASWCITQVKMHPLTPAEVDAVPVFKIAGTVDELFESAFTLLTDGQSRTVELGESTLCEINGSAVDGVSPCLSLLEAGMCIEVATHDDPYTSSHLGALRVVWVNATHCAAAE